ncbi:MAG: YitT family protein [Bacteroidales bacterium]|nr:YitT family protein [Candidatus Sodaliphilus aphodohippi]
MQTNDRKVLTYAKDYVFIVLGLAFYAFGFSAFIIPEKVVTGGVVGIASLTHFAFGWDLAITNYAINIILLAIAFKTVGKQFVIRTIFGATVASLFLFIALPLFPKPLVEQQPFMNVIIGAAFCGIGLGMCFAHNGSSAGTDIIAAMVAKHSNVSFGRMMLYCDMVIISSSYLVFHQIDNVVYGFVFLVVNAFMADYVINNNRQAVQFFIVSDKWEDIANAINNDAHRGCTLIHGTGWYTKQDVKMLFVVTRKMESVNVFRIVKAIDPGAFIIHSNCSGAYGFGFDEVKVRLNKYKPKINDECMTPEQMFADVYKKKLQQQEKQDQINPES